MQMPFKGFTHSRSILIQITFQILAYAMSFLLRVFARRFRRFRTMHSLDNVVF